MLAGSLQKEREEGREGMMKGEMEMEYHRLEKMHAVLKYFHRPRWQ